MMVRRARQQRGSGSGCGGLRVLLHRRRVLSMIAGVLLFFGAVPTVSSLCEDDEAGLAQLLIDNGRAETFRCADLKNFCGTDGQEGWVAGTYCCGTCGGGGESDTADDGEPIVFDDSGLPPRDGKPLELYLLGGQSECVGAARASDLAADGDKYPELQGTIDGVWLAGYDLPASPGSFLIGPMSADLDGYRFGPEVSFGERIHDAKGGSSNVMMVKYCLGGTNVREHWNPDTEANRWDKSEDDGTAAWLRSRTYFDEADKGNVRAHLFVNMVYTIRRTEEALREAGIPYEWSGIVWDQGPADNDPDDPNLWKTFGEDTARVWEGFRDAIGETVPIIDTGAAATNQMRSGKEYAVQIVEGGLAKNIEFGASSSDDAAGSCVITPTETCLDDPHRFTDYRIFDHFGWDPLIPDEMIEEFATKKPVKTFHWFVEFPTNMHSAYEGMILRGRMLANAFLRTFAADDESDVVAFGINVEEDLAERFPSDRCPVGVKPSAGNFCWIDYRQGVPVPTATTTTTPTGSPTASPTADPTRTPTLAPTKNPTLAPTRNPTAAPTASPTAAPTLAPTLAPTEKPTENPTEKPTENPTENPTARPTGPPVDFPTTPPTEAPTKDPTARPTASPTRSPTATPTRSPTAAPTADPTKAPTTTPTEDPTKSPTARPTGPPVDFPTTPPTEDPTRSPTRSPSASPTASPTRSPTVRPTASPDGVPSTETPTESPTTEPLAATTTPTTTTTTPTESPTATETPAAAAPAEVATGAPTPPQPSPTSSDEDNVDVVKSGGLASSWSLSLGRRIFRRRGDGDDHNDNNTVGAAVVALICVTAVGPMLLLP